MIVLLSLMLASPAPSPDSAVQHSLDRIADRCRLPRKVFHLDADGNFHFRPDASSPYRDVDCALVQIKKHRLTNRLPMGFVGNVAYDPEMKP